MTDAQIEELIIGMGYECLLALAGQFAISQMSGEITHAADDVTSIRNRLKELEAEREEVRRNRDPDLATGQFLDLIGAEYAEKRLTPCETDYTFRQRVLKKIRGE
jgi:hypothetical protein